MYKTNGLSVTNQLLLGVHVQFTSKCTKNESFHYLRPLIRLATRIIGRRDASVTGLQV